MEIVLTTALLIGVVIGLTEVIKRALKVEKNYLPLIAVLIAVGLGLILDWGTFNGKLIIEAIVIGLTACGLFSFRKPMVHVVRGVLNLGKRVLLRK